MPASRRRFSGDERAVSEVIGYILSFSVAFILLVTMLYTFSLLNTHANEAAARAEFADISNRVAAAVLGGVDMASELKLQASQVTSGYDQPFQYRRSLDVPHDSRGILYTVDLDPNFVNVTSSTGFPSANSTNFKAGSLVADAGECADLATFLASDAIVCSISGSLSPGRSTIAVVYRFDPNPSPIVNQILLE